MRCGRGLGAALAVIACGHAAQPEPGACGDDEPRALAALAEAEIVLRVHPAPDAARLLYEIGDPARPRDPVRLAIGDPCGAPAQTLAQAVTLLELDRDAYVCDEPSGTLWRVALGDGARTQLGTQLLCAVKPTDFGVVALRPGDDGTAAIVLLDRNGAGDGVTLLEQVRVPEDGAPGGPIAVGERELLAHTVDGRLIHVELATRERTLVRDEVAEVRFDDTGGTVLWQRGVVDDPDPLAVGEVALVDLRDGPDAPDRVLCSTRLSWTAVPFFGDWVALRAHAWGDDRLVSRLDGHAVALPEPASVRAVVDGVGVIYVVGNGDWHDLDVRLWDPVQQQHRALLRGAGFVRFADDGLERFEPDPDFVHGRLSLLPYDGGDAIVLADDLAWPYARRDDGTILWVRDDDGDGSGALQAKAPEHAAVTLADEARVHDPVLLQHGLLAPDVAFHAHRDGALALWRDAWQP
jgi:hypothetical protein